ncbi:MAG: NAD(P)-binding protein [Thermoprotei archaeon]
MADAFPYVCDENRFKTPIAVYAAATELVSQAELGGLEDDLPLDCALARSGRRFIYRSVKLGRPRGVMEETAVGNLRKVFARGAGVVNPVEASSRGVDASLNLSATLGSRIASKVSWFSEAGFQNSVPFRYMWRTLWKTVTSSANLASLEDYTPPPDVTLRQVSADVLVVGAGLAGLGVAAALSECGVGCVVVDPWPDPGGRTRFYDVRPDELEAETYSGFCRAEKEKVGSKATFMQGKFTGVYEENTGYIASADGVTHVKFNRIVYCTGSRSPPPLIAGNDLPGVVSAQYALRLLHYGALDGAVTVYAEDQYGVKVYGLLKAKLPETELLTPLEAEGKLGEAPAYVKGRREVEAVGYLKGDGSKNEARCRWLVYSTSRQPALELPAQGGVGYVYDPLKGFVVDSVDPSKPPEQRTVWVAGSASGACELDSSYHHGRAVGFLIAEDAERFFSESSRVKSRTPPPSRNVPISPAALVCFCEDVLASDLLGFRSQGVANPQKVKRRTGWLTGPCQGKLCLASGMSLLCSSGRVEPPTQRLPAEPTPLGLLASS